MDQKASESSCELHPHFFEELGDSLSSTRVAANLYGSTLHRTELTACTDRWVLSSGLHKAIRFGLYEQAAVIAATLVTVDAPYFWRRLPVVIFEDVGLGSLKVSLEALHVCRDMQLRRRFEPLGVAAYLAKRLASAPKCRSACDLLCLIESQNGRDELAIEVSRLALEEAVQIASQPTQPLRSRAAALLRIDQAPTRQGDPRRKALLSVSTNLSIPAGITQSLIMGKTTEHMTTFLPLIAELMSKRTLRMECRDLGSVADTLDGVIPYASLDKHTRAGQMAIRYWLARMPKVKALLHRSSLTVNVDQVIGMALFHIESSQLDRRITNDCLDILQIECERSEMATLGMNEDAAAELYSLMRAALPDLNRIRKRVWATQ